MLIGAGIGIPFQQNVLARLLGSAEFFAPLTHSAIPTRAAFGTTGTFTRATTSTWPNNDGYLVTGVAGEIGFVGARRVRNLLGNTENLLGAGWTAVGGAPVQNVVAPDGTTTGWSKAVAGVGDEIRYLTTYDPAGKAGLGSVWLKGSGTISIRISNNVDQQFVTQFTLSSEWTRFSTDVNTANTASGVWLFGIFYNTGDTATSVDVWHPQLEDVTAQTTQTAGEYVSVGVESAPYYHGSFVDGVKCFPTDLSGNPIPSTTMLGYVAEGARTNLCLQSNAFTTTWLNIGTPSATQNVVGPDGATSAWTLTDNDAGAAEAIEQEVALTAAAYTLSVFVGKTSGAQSSYPCFAWYTALATEMQAATIDTTNGVITDWTGYTGFTMAAGRSVRISSYNEDFWRVELTKTGTATGHKIDLFPAGTTNPTQSTGAVDAAAQGSAVFYGAQVELGSFASSYIPTTTIAVARNADVLTYSSAGNISDTAGWAYSEYQSNIIDGNYGTALSTATGRLLMHYSATNVGVNDGVNEVAKTGLTNISTGVRKRVGAWSSDPAITATGDGATPATFAAYDGSMAGTSISIGYRNITGVEHIFGTIRNVRIGQRQLSASELGAITS